MDARRIRGRRHVPRQRRIAAGVAADEQMDVAAVARDGVERAKDRAHPFLGGDLAEGGEQHGVFRDAECLTDAAPRRIGVALRRRRQ
jgi:hypothetical protein